MFSPCPYILGVKEVWDLDLNLPGRAHRPRRRGRQWVPLSHLADTQSESALKEMGLLVFKAQD